MLTLVVLAGALIAAAMLAMAVGLLLGNRCLRGSCGGAETLGPDGVSLACEACPRRKDAAPSSSEAA